MPRATPLAALLVVAVVAAGCLGGPSTPTGTPTADPTPSPTATQSPTGLTPSPTATQSPTEPTSPTPTSSPEPADPTADGTPAGTQGASERPDPSHQITVANRWNRSVEMQVTVTRAATNETVHEGTYDLTAGAEHVVYDTAAADPDGIEAFTVTVTAVNATESVTVETSQCYGDVYAEVTEEGELNPYYAIC